MAVNERPAPARGESARSAFLGAEILETASVEDYGSEAPS